MAIACVGYLSSPVVLGPIEQGTGWSALWMTVAIVALPLAASTVVARRLERTSDIAERR